MGNGFIINADHLATSLSDIKQQRVRATCVLIVPTNVSIAISILDEKIIAYDSHRLSAFGDLTALTAGAGILDCTVTKATCRILQYLESMIKKH